jgi:cytochrome c2
MRKLPLYGLIAAALVVLSSPAAAEGDSAKGKAAYAKCAICHQIGPDAQNLVGPQLNGMSDGKRRASPITPCTPPA